MFKLLIISLFTTLSFSAELPSVQALSGGAIDASNAQTIADDQFQPQMTITAEDFNAKFQALKFLIDNIEQPQLPEPELTLVAGNAPVGYSGDFSDDYTSYLSSNPSSFASAPVSHEFEVTLVLDQAPYNTENSYNVNAIDIYFKVGTQLDPAGSVYLTSITGSSPSGVSVEAPLDGSQYEGLNTGDIVKIRFEINTPFQQGSNYLHISTTNTGLEILAEGSPSNKVERMGLMQESSGVQNILLTTYNAIPILQIFQ